MLIQITQPTTVDFGDGLGAVHVDIGTVDIQSPTEASRVVASQRGVYANAADNPNTATVKSGVIAGEIASIGATVSFKFAQMTNGKLLASLVAGSTATRVGLRVTVTATAHGLPASSFSGVDFFFPGCASLDAGWYPNFLYLSSNSIQFDLPYGTAGADFTGESINSGVAYTTPTRATELYLPENTMIAGSRATFKMLTSGSTGAGTKYVRGLLETRLVGTLSWTTTLQNIFCEMTVACFGLRQVSIQYSYDTKPHTSWNGSAYDMTAKREFSITLESPAAGEYIFLAYACLEVVK